MAQTTKSITINTTKHMLKLCAKDIIKSGCVTHIKIDAIDAYGNEQEVEFEADDYKK